GPSGRSGGELRSMIDAPLATWRQRLRDSRFLIVFEFLLVAAVFIADEHHLIYFSKTPYLLALGWLSMAVRGISWRDVGLHLETGWLRLVVIGIAAGVAMEGLELFVTQPLLVKLTGKYPDLSDFQNLVGNIKLLLIYIGLSWIVAGVGEELVWRGYLMNRVTDLAGRGAGGWAASLILVSAAFGLAHSYQDITGIVENMIAGVLLGILYLAGGRRLIVPIIAHGIVDSVDFLIIYSGHYPGM
ncbi:MAG TPA: type II CAAX endopeptidase family protein, partial [Acidobacteriota bacterium]|nr:type II CAAX endopeptidase family protein [Acidobacteriota bacterium]